MASTTYSQDIPLEQDITVDLTESQIEVVYANQYDDSSRQINCHIQNNGVDFPCENYTISLWIKKTNDCGFTRIIGVDGFGSVSNNIVSFPILEEMTYSHGRQVCNLELLQGDSVVYSCVFYLRVNKVGVQQEDILDSDDYKSVHDEFYLLEEKINKLGDLRSEICTNSSTTPTNQEDGDYWTRLLDENGKAERYVKQGDEYKLLSYATSSKSVEMSDGTDLQTKMNSVDSDISNEVSRATAKENEIASNLSSHTGNTSNPHSVTKAQVGLGNVENKSSATIRGELTKSNVTTALGYTPLNQTLKGSASGLAELDSNGKVPSSQLPSYVDDVIEGYLSGGKFYKESAHTTEISGETGKIYIDLSTEKTYRWSGSAFVVISETLALGETSSTAYRGDRGKTAYDHSQSTHARTDATKVEKSSTNGNIKINGTETTVYTHPGGTNPHGTTKSDIGLGNVDNTKDIDKPISTKQQEKFDEINSNLTDLKVGEVAGGKNIWKYDSYFKDYCGYTQNGNEFYGTTSDILKMPNIYLNDNKSQYTISFDSMHETNGYAGISVVVDYTDGTQDFVPVTSEVVTYKKFTLTTNPNKTISLIKFSYGSYKAGNSYIKNFQIEKGNVATPYEPYIPSVKMLADKSTQIDDNNMLGYVVPNEMPIKNYVDSNGVFHQRVKRIDLGDISWNYHSDSGNMYADGVVSDRKMIGDTITKSYCNKYAIYEKNLGNVSLLTEDKSIGMQSTVPSRLVIRDTSYTDATTFKNSLKGIYLYYELATEITTNVDGNEAVTKVNESLSVIGKCKNLAKASASFQTKTVNGVTCTNNGDGTFSLSGSNTGSTTITIDIDIAVNYTGSAKLLGCPKNMDGLMMQTCYDGSWGNSNTWEYGKGKTLDNASKLTKVAIFITSGLTVNDLIFKPMVTTNFDATYDDFVPYTGEGDTLTADVASLKNDLSTHTHKYAGSSSVGGSATSAVKLDSSAGSATQPVYFSGGKPVATTYTLGKSVPSDAVFIDTWRGIQNNLTSDSTTDSLSAAQGKVLKGLIDKNTISVYSAAWIGTTNDSGTAILTDPFTINAGTYLVLWKVPNSNANNGLIQLVVDGTGQVEGLSLSAPYTTGAQIITVSKRITTIYLRAASSITVTYSLLERGWLKAIRLSN